MKHFLLKASLLLMSFMMALTVYAQDRTVSGTVTDLTTSEPLAGVNVIIKGTSTGTITDINGTYSVELKASQNVLTFTFIGFVKQDITLSPSQTTVDVIMEEDVTSLSEVVITGLATSVKRSNLANSVESIDAKSLVGITEQPTMDNALYGKVKGANITSNSGAPGGGISIKLRGLTSINGANQPLFIIDGVYVDNSEISAGLNVVSAASGGGSQSNQDNPSNRIADLNPYDIQSLEVLKGASAAAIYGSRASSGVVVITTKKGKNGRTSVNFSQNIGITTQLNKLGQRTWDADKAETHFGANGRAAFIDAESQGKLHDYEKELYGEQGLLLTTNLSVSGGDEKTTFYTAVTRKKDEGIVKNTGYDKTSVRLNLTHDITDWLNIEATTNYISSSADRGFFNNDNSGTTMGISYVGTPVFAQLFADAEGNYPDNPYAASNFLQTRDLVTNNEAVNRIIVGTKISARLFKTDKMSLRLIARAGLDNYNLATTAIFPNTLQFQKNGNGLNGVSIQGNTVNKNTNFNAFLVHDFFPNQSLSFRTQFGITAENFDQNTILGTASNLNGSQTNLDQAGNQQIDQNRIIQKDRGFFAQEEVNYEDKIIGTLGIRGDKSSNNGDANKMYYYPKGSMALNLHNFNFWSVDFMNQLKLRVAYGEAGNFATFGDKYTFFNNAIIDGTPGWVINNKRGNGNVGPERQSETEFGFDMSFLSNKLKFDVTYYIQNITDLLLTADVPNSSGFTRQVTNAAELQNKGIEIGLNWNIINTSKFNWNFNTNFWKNQGKITKLNVPSFTTGGFADFLGQFRIKEGRSPSEIVGIGPADQQDEDGLVVYGDSEADFNMSFTNSFTYKNFELSFLFHWKKGGDNINLTQLLSDFSGTSYDYDKIDLDPEGQLGNGDFRQASFLNTTAPFVEDAGYFRMREIGLFYNIPRTALKDLADIRIGFTGNNLINSFKYRSYDPEVSNFGGKGLSSGVEVTPFPSSKRYNFHINVSF